MSDLNSWEDDPAAQDDNLSRQAQQMNLNNNPQGGAPSFRPGANSFQPGAQSFQPGQNFQQYGGGYDQSGYQQNFYNQQGTQGYGYPQYGGQQGGYQQYPQAGGYSAGYNQGGYSESSFTYIYSVGGSCCPNSRLICTAYNLLEPL
jgi:peptide chain release factor subunit 3